MRRSLRDEGEVISAIREPHLSEGAGPHSWEECPAWGTKTKYITKQATGKRAGCSPSLQRGTGV